MKTKPFITLLGGGGMKFRFFGVTYFLEYFAKRNRRVLGPEGPLDVPFHKLGTVLVHEIIPDLICF